MSDAPETQSAVIIAKLREYNLWRRGGDQLAQPNPTEIGLYIDTVCDIAKRVERERDEAREVLRQIASMDTSQNASPQQCGAVLMAMNALGDRQ